MLTAKENPFAAHRIEALPFQFRQGDWEYQLQRLDQLNWRASIVGDKGSGKTTLLLELRRILRDERRLPESPGPVHYCFAGRTVRDRLDQMMEFENAMRQNQVLLIDGIERFSWRQRRRILGCKSARMVVTAHRPLDLPVWLHCQTSPELARSLLRQLIGNQDPLMISHCNQLFKKHRGNIRDVFRSLYDHLAFEEQFSS